MTKTGFVCLTIASSLALVGLGLPSHKAQADKKTHLDPDDTSGSLDIESILHRHDGYGRKELLLHRVSTYEAWETSALQDFSTDIVFNFYVDNELKRDILVDASPDGSPYAEIKDWDSRRIIGFARVWRPDDRSLQIEFPPRALGRHVSKYKWSVSTSWHEEGHLDCGEDIHGPIACVDHAPDEGGAVHKLS